jgi:hypothetical protein
MDFSHARIDPRPSSFLQCFDVEDGFQCIPYSLYIQRQQELDESYAQEMETYLSAAVSAASEERNQENYSRPKKRVHHRAILEWSIPVSGTRIDF